MFLNSDWTRILCKSTVRKVSAPPANTSTRGITTAGAATSVTQTQIALMVVVSLTAKLIAEAAAALQVQIEPDAQLAIPQSFCCCSVLVQTVSRLARLREGTSRKTRKARMDVVQE
jgi:hypothetical protein